LIAFPQTYISSILLSINPYKMLPIYSPKIIQKWRALSTAREALPPHVYSIADFAYSNMVADAKNQAVVISGESGSGKTEATKLILQYLADCSGQSGEVEDAIMEANPILESFGNAKTVRNNNSSRFGKWVEIKFNSAMRICGAHIESYLLEKTRVVQQSPGERNYHVFYELCAGATAEEKAELQLQGPHAYKYLSGGQCWEIDGVSDEREFQNMRRALTTLKFSEDDQKSLLATLAGILHLGNLNFNASGDDASTLDGSSSELLDLCARILCVQRATLEKALLTRSITVMREVMNKPNTKQQAEDGRDALSKFLFDRMFEWLIYRINKALATDAKKAYAFIGVLDIFGFEIFSVNRFEQLCINYANEKLQQHFNRHIFQMEQDEYKSDGLTVARVDFVDNQACLDVIDKKPTGILPLIDEELKVPKSTDATLLANMHKQHEKNKYYVKPKISKPIFGVNHFAGEVTYVVEGFMEKNKDQLNDDLVQTLLSSTSTFVKQLSDRSFITEADMIARQERAAALASPTHTRNASSMSGMKSPTAMPTGKTATVSAQFREQLGGLVATLEATSPHFIRCLKPNELKVAGTFDANFVVRQLRYLGIKEVVNIRQLGFPMRRTHADFVQRYSLLCPDVQYKATRDDINKMMASVDRVGTSNWAIGNTKVFMKNITAADLEAQREARIVKLMVRLQARIRARRVRKLYLKVKATLNSLREYMKDAESNLEQLESAVDLASELKLVHHKLIKEAVALIKRTKEIIAIRKSLETACAAKDTASLKEALKRADEIQMGNAHPAVITARALLEKLEAHNAAIAAAISGRQIEALRAALARAAELGLHRDIEKQAGDVLKRVEAEQAAIAGLEAAIAAADIAQLHAAEKVANDIGLEHASLTKARALIKTLKEQAAAVESLQAAIAARSTALLESARTSAAKVQSNDKIAALLKEAGELMEQLIREGLMQDAASALASAIAARNIGALQAAIRQAESAGASHHELCVQAQDLVMALVGAAGARDALTNALQSRKVDDLRVAVQIAEKQGGDVLQSDEFQQAQQMLKTLQTAFAAIEAATAARALAPLAAAVSAAIAAGLENHETVRAAAALRDSMEQIRQCEVSLNDAVSSNDEGVLKAAVARAAKLKIPQSNASLVNAQAALSRLSSARIAAETAEKNAEDGGAAAAQAEAEYLESIGIHDGGEQQQPLDSVPEDGPATAAAPAAPAGKAAPASLAQVVEVVHRVSIAAGSGARLSTAGSGPLRGIFEPSNYRKDQFQLARFSGLKSGDDYVSGKFFGKQALKDSMLTWNKDVIPNALCKLHSGLEKTALNLFRNIQGFMGDRSYSFPDTLASEVLEEGLKQSAIRDEIYVQLMKQCSFNPKSQACVRGWQLLGLTCETFLPSTHLLPFVLYYLSDHVSNDIGGVVPMRRQYAKYCMDTLKKTANSPPRLQAPSIDHVVAFKDRVMSSGSVIIGFCDGSSMEMEVDPSVLASHAVANVCAELKITDKAGFAIYQVGNGPDRYINNDECLLDFDAAKHAGGAVRFVFKKRIFHTIELPLSNDPMALSLLFHQVHCFSYFQFIDFAHSFTYSSSFGLQAFYDLQIGNLTLSMEDTIHLFAVAGYIESRGLALTASDAIDPESIFRVKRKTMPNHLKHVSALTQKVFSERVAAAEAALAGQDISVHTFLDACVALPYFGSQLHAIKQEENPNFPNTMFIGVNMRGMHFLHSETRAVLGSFYFDAISGWTDTPVLFVTRVVDRAKNRLETLCCYTNQGKVITTLLQNHVDIIVANMKNKKK
jgi:myosin heavy subunit